jgi:hypothetical protein
MVIAKDSASFRTPRRKQRTSSGVSLTGEGKKGWERVPLGYHLGAILWGGKTIGGMKGKKREKAV